MEGSVQEAIPGSSACGAVRGSLVVALGRGSRQEPGRHGPRTSRPLGQGCVSAGLRPQRRRPELSAAMGMSSVLSSMVPTGHTWP